VILSQREPAAAPARLACRDARDDRALDNLVSKNFYSASNFWRVKRSGRDRDGAVD